MTRDILEPIQKKIDAWIYYEENEPKTEYWTHREAHDKYRSENDLDCILADGNLYADTIISLNFYLRQVIYKIWDGKKIWNNSIYIPHKSGDSKEFWAFMKELQKNLGDYLPENSPLVQKLCILFRYGQTRANVMILPDRQMQRKGEAPYYDYMPHFLYECFQDGYFCGYFAGDNDLKEWIRREHLEMFFKDRANLSPDSIIDLNANGNIKSNLTTHIDIAIDNCIEIIKERQKYYEGDYR